MSASILLFGGGGHCASCIDVILSTHLFEIIGIVDSADRIDQEISGVPVIGSDDDIDLLRKNCGRALITVGFVESVAVRKRLYDLLSENDFELPVLTASTAYRSDS